MKEPTITIEEVLSEIERLTQTDSAGLSVSEIRTQTGWARDRVVNLLHKAKMTNRLQIGKKSIEDLSGRRTVVPCYMVLASSTKKRSSR